MIKRLNQRIEDIHAKAANMEESEVELKMELEKKEVRFKQLEKEVKNRLN